MIELIKTRCKRLDKTGQFHDKYIEGMCDMVWQSLAYQFYESAIVDPKMYSKNYDSVAVSIDSNGNYYSTLPEVILNLPRTNSGILRINKNANKEFEFVPISERHFTFMQSQEVYQIGTKIFYYNDKDIVYFGDSMTALIAASGVDMQLCIPFSKFGLDEELPIPANQGAPFISSVIELIIGTPLVDLRNTNSETITQ